MDDDLGVMLATLLRAYRDAVTPLLQDLPQGQRGYETLREVVRCAQPSQLALASRLGIDRTVMTYLIDDLVEAGFVERQPNPADRRQRQVVPTSQGARLIADTCRQVRSIEDSLLGALSGDERGHLRALLAKACESRESVESSRVGASSGGG